MATIKQIESRTIHQIQSGQVIIDLCSVVKELVENSIDAGATHIDVRFKNQGLDLIEVQDNGSGISPDNYSSVALKHHTSKLSTYADISSLHTFGFRGEALASLCALSNLTITTCQADQAPKASKLGFNASGELRDTTVVAAQRGTTVTVEKLFHNLPVRRRELERNIKREWHKVIALLNQYACIQTGLKFSVSQQPSKGKRIVLFATNGNSTTRDNIINVFGAKSMTALIPLELDLEMQPSAVDPALQSVINPGSVSKDVRVVGHVSRPSHGGGRQTPDRQMFFVNGRPCGLPQFAKTFNDVYKSYNASQSPFVFADIRLDTHMYDVNVSPDKRSILLHDQNQLLDTLRESLVALFDSQDFSVPVSDLHKPLKSTPAKATTENNPEQPIDSSHSRDTARAMNSYEHMTRSVVEDEEEDEGDNEDADEDEDPTPLAHGRARRILGANSLTSGGSGQNLIHRYIQQGSNNVRHNRRQPSASSSESDEGSKSPQRERNTGDLPDEGSPEPPGYSPNHQPAGRSPRRFRRVSDSAPRSSSGVEASGEGLDDLQELSIPAPLDPHRRSPGTQWRGRRSATQLATITIGNETTTSLIVSPPKRTRIDKGDSQTSEAVPTFKGRLSRLFSSTEGNGEGGSSLEPGSGSNIEEGSSDAEVPLDGGSVEGASSGASSPVKSLHNESGAGSPEWSNSPRATAIDQEEKQAGGSNLIPHSRRKDSTLRLVQQLSVDQIVFSRSDRGAAHTGLVTDQGEDGLDDIADLDAESKLSLIISKQDFSAMRIVGQFNLGFIIATRPAPARTEEGGEPKFDELFIIDQHATDEKYNFERLQSTTVVQSQRLVQPKRLDLTALEEEIVLENMGAIETNGFKVHMDTSGDYPVGSRCSLLALPMSRETTFTVADLEELISLLGDESTETKHVPRPSKVRKMFAMRACRSSIMIGKALTKSQMRTVVTHMGELDKPWNCPHGRPTMRHLCRMQALGPGGWTGDTGSLPVETWQTYM